MTLPINDALIRIIAIAKESLTTLTPAVVADGVPYFYHTQEAFPYFTIRVSDMTSAGYGEGALTQELDADTYTIILRLVIGHITEGYSGQPEDLLHDYIPVVKAYLNARDQLGSAAYPTELRYLMDAHCTGCSGYRVFQNAGISALQVGTEFTIVCQFNENIDQAYL
jgi:hypothetical protein